MIRRAKARPRSGLTGIALAACLSATAAAAQDGGPLSAIDWLSRSVETPPEPAGSAGPAAALRDEPPTATNATAPQVTVTPLDTPGMQPVGLLPPDVTGLPPDLWAASPEDALVLLLRAIPVETVPALQELLVTLMLAEATPPRPSGGSESLLLARIDKLLDMGALEPAQALIETADPEAPDLFRRWFDVSILTGTEDRTCAQMQDRPALAPTLAARVFCLARGGDWNAAALTLNTARALGDVSAEEEALLARFLDPGLFEGDPPLPRPDRISPLVFRLFEGVGQRIATAGLPRAFAHADLDGTAAWRNELEAAERLVRGGAIPDNRLLGIYTAREPAASGGVWDRAAAVQRIEAALRDSDAAAVAAALPGVWQAMTDARTEVALANLFGADLIDLGLLGSDAPAADIALRLALLAPDYEATALDLAENGGATAVDPLWLAVARGDTSALERPQTARAAAVHDAFAGAEPPAELRDLVEEGRLGEAILRALARFEAGRRGDPAGLTDALSLLRDVGLEDIARRAALQLLLLERPG